jgi:dTDP-glucose 4,6-dehydratase
MARAVVTGGAGFLGSHLCRALLGRGYRVIAVDNFSTGRPGNVADLVDDPSFTLLDWDITGPDSFDGLIDGPVDAILHFASPASPPDYLARPIETLEVGSTGTRRTLDLARATGARYLLASTSEVYGDPLVHPQSESYWGNVNPVGPRSVYDEAKRYAEALATAYRSARGVDVKIARIFNTFGPGLRPGDGRALPNFITQALRGEPLTIYGDGSQTRSFCYIDDEVRGLLALLESDWTGGPLNIGNPDEHTILDLAHMVRRVTGSTSSISYFPLPENDPVRRRPDISLARRVLGWSPEVDLMDGVARTVDWFRKNGDG